MGEEHARVAPVLGAYAAGALGPEAAAEVRSHLETCAACRAEAERLARAAAWLGTTQEAPPPERLGDAVLASAAARDDLDRLLDGLTDEQRRVLLIHGWDVGELLEHLAADRPGLAAGPDGMLQRAFETWIHADDLRVALGREPSPPAPAHVHAMVALGARLLRSAIRTLGVDPSGRAVALRLEGPGGGTWTVPPGGDGPVAATLGCD